MSNTRRTVAALAIAFCSVCLAGTAAHAVTTDPTTAEQTTAEQTTTGSQLTKHWDW